MSGLPTVPPDHLLSSNSTLPTQACPKLYHYLHIFGICCNKLHSLLNPILRPNNDPVAACKPTCAYTGMGLKGRNVLVLDFVIKMVNSCYYKCDFLPSKNCWLSIMTFFKKSVKWALHTGTGTYPRVLMKPLVDPSAYREQMSPMCRKLDILSDMFGTQGSTCIGENMDIIRSFNITCLSWTHPIMHLFSTHTQINSSKLETVLRERVPLQVETTLTQLSGCKDLHREEEKMSIRCYCSPAAVVLRLTCLGAAAASKVYAPATGHGH